MASIDYALAPEHPYPAASCGSAVNQPVQQPRLIGSAAPSKAPESIGKNAKRGPRSEPRCLKLESVRRP
ncbi:MAG: hypothetical protein JKY00_14080 [Roseicyclus sp.]|nr:hypothetical protein [Roseicyclus sp.]